MMNSSPPYSNRDFLLREDMSEDDFLTLIASLKNVHKIPFGWIITHIEILLKTFDKEAFVVNYINVLTF